MEFRAFYDKKNKKLSIKPGITINNDSLLLNGALYNYFQLMKEYKLANDSRSDDEIFLRLLMLKGFDALKLINADYSICYYTNNIVYLIRDLLGTKPVYYVNNGELFEFRDEPFQKSEELMPGTILEYNVKIDSVKIHDKMELEDSGKNYNSFEKSMEEFAAQLFRSVSSRVYNLDNFAILNDNSISAKLLIKVCTDLGCSFETIKQGLKDFEEVCREAGGKILLTTLNSELKQNFNFTTYYLISKKYDAELRTPFSDIKLIQTSMKIKQEYKEKLLPEIMKDLQ